MLIIGEKINSSIKSVGEAIEKKDSNYIKKLAIEQVKAGAAVIDVNAGMFLEKEAELLAWLVETVQETVDVPLCIDSPNPKALEAALAVSRKKAIINSISAEKERYKSVIPLINRYGASIIALCMDDQGIPATIAQRMEIARALTDRIMSDGVNPDHIYLDVMVQPIGTENESGLVALNTVRAIRLNIPGVHITCGLSNVSFGLPKRRLLNQAFAVALATCGMDTFFIDPLDNTMMALLRGTNAILGLDDYCCDYLGAFRTGKLD